MHAASSEPISDYLRVTEVLYPFSGMSSIPKGILQKAADRGTEVHLMCEGIVSGMPPLSVDDEYAGYVNSFKQWAQGKVFPEKPDRFYCDELMITGECDGIYESADGVVIFDLKTSVKEGSTWPLQGSAYAYLARKHGIPVVAIEFVKLDKHGAEAKVYRYEERFDLFVKCLDVYRHFFHNAKVVDIETLI